MYDWYSFLFPADEWFVAYATVPPSPSFTMFSIGHTVELYLKAARAKQIGSVATAINYSHRVRDLWKDCKSRDRDFMPDYEIRDSIMHALCKGDPNLGKRVSKQDREFYLEHQELYLIVKFLPDLKYVGLPPKSTNVAFSFGFLHPNPYWTKFIRELRHYLGHPSQGRMDYIRYSIDSGRLPVSAVQYLQELCA